MSESHSTGAPNAQPSYDEEAGPGKRKIIIAGAAALLLLAGGGGFLLLKGGGSSPSDTGVVASAAHRTPKASLAAPSTDPVVALPPPATIKTGRNPFKALVVDDTLLGEGAPTPGATTTTSPGTGSSTTSGSSATSGSATTGGSGPTVTPSPAPTTPQATYNLRLVSSVTTNGTAVQTWVVDGVTKNTIGGQRFGKYGELVQLGVAPDNSGVTIQVGDGTPFNVLVGTTVVVL